MATRSCITGVFVVVAALATFGCDDDASGPGEGGRIYDLSVEVLEWYLRGDLQPPVSPDPILCQVTMRLANTSPTEGITGVSIPSAVAYLSDDGAELGTIRFETDWDGTLTATEVDTITVTKIEESQEIFPPPCGKSVFLRVKFVKTAVQSRLVKTTSEVVTCPVAVAPGR